MEVGIWGSGFNKLEFWVGDFKGIWELEDSREVGILWKSGIFESQDLRKVRVVIEGNLFLILVILKPVHDQAPEEW